MTPSPQKTSVRPAEISNRRPRFRSNRTRYFTESVIREMTRLALDVKAVNLAQGFPDFSAPEPIKRAAQEAIAPGFQSICHHLGRQTVPGRHRRQIPEVVRPGLRSGERNYGLLRINGRNDRLHARRDQSRR